jgi:pyruvate dehydrogenase E2 component (dihydrolipoamide acetyltransferase)
MSEIRMPSLGADMEAGKLVEWIRRPGDDVKAGDVIAVIETQKGAIEIEVFESGTIDALLVQVGDTVPVGTPIMTLRRAGPPAAAPATPTIAPAPPSAIPAMVPDPSGGTHGRASPAARRFAAEHGIDLATIAGSGPEGAVVFVDVETAWRARASVKPAASESGEPRRQAGADLAEMRRAIAAAMARAKREIPHYYLSTTLDVTEATRRLQAANAERPPERRLLAAALHLKALASTLRRHTDMNGFWVDGGFRPSARIHLAPAIAIRGGGLVAPAIHDTDRLTHDEIMERLRDLVARVRAGRFRGSELSDPTCTLTSLGERGVEAITPIINPPQVAIVGIGSPVERPWIVDGAVMARTIITLTLAADHRVSDGHRGALMLADFAARVAAPELS